MSKFYISSEIQILWNLHGLLLVAWLELLQIRERPNTVHSGRVFAILIRWWRLLRVAINEGKCAVAGRGLVTIRGNRSAISALHEALTWPVLSQPGGTGTPWMGKWPSKGFLTAAQGRFKPYKLIFFFSKKNFRWVKLMLMAPLFPWTASCFHVDLDFQLFPDDKNNRLFVFLQMPLWRCHVHLTLGRKNLVTWLLWLEPVPLSTPEQAHGDCCCTSPFPLGICTSSLNTL